MRKVRFGIIGSGKIVTSFLEAASNVDNFTFHAFYSRSKEKVEQFQEKYNVPYGYTNLNEMLENDEVEAIYIASPNFLHFEQTMLSLNHGKNVLVEKPFCTNAKEAEKMINLAKEKNKLLMEAMRPTLVPNFEQVTKNIHKIGKVRRYTASYCQYSSRYDAFLKGEVLNAFNKELSNGALMDIGVYCIAPMIHLFGMPDEVKAIDTKLYNGIDGQGQVLFSYKDMEAHIQYSKISNSYLPTEIQGEKGTLIIEKISGIKKVVINYIDGTVEDIGVFQEENDMVYEIKEFISLIHQQKISSEKNSFERSLQVMNLLDQVREKLDIAYPADNID